MRSITVDLPEELVARCEAAAAARDITMGEIVLEFLTLALTVPLVPADKPRRSAWDAMQQYCGIVDGPGDLSTNPKYMEGFGCD